MVLAGGRLPDNGGDRPQVVVTVPFDPLRRAFGAGVIDTGDRLSADAARRLACDARILPAVLDGAGQPLDLGRERRLFTGPLRRALVLRDGGCAFPGCDRPPRWCDGHHVIHWADGGATSLANAVLLCGHHHRLIHDARAGGPSTSEPTVARRSSRPRGWTRGGFRAATPSTGGSEAPRTNAADDAASGATAHRQEGSPMRLAQRATRLAAALRCKLARRRDCSSLALARPAQRATRHQRGEVAHIESTARARLAQPAQRDAAHSAREATPTQPVARWVHPPWPRACATLVRRVGPP